MNFVVLAHLIRSKQVPVSHGMVLDISVTESYGRTYYSSQRLFLKTAMFNFPHDGNTCCKPGNSMLLFFYTVDHVCAVKYLGPLHVGSKPGILMIHMHTIKI